MLKRRRRKIKTDALGLTDRQRAVIDASNDEPCDGAARRDTWADLVHGAGVCIVAVGVVCAIWYGAGRPPLW